MAKSTDSIWITPTGANHAEELILRRALRVLPGKREVFDASWNGRTVIVKVFFQPVKARYHYWRELRGLRRLAELEFRAPVPLLSGRTEDGRWAVVTEKIEGAMSLLEARNAVHKSRQRELLLDLASRELARLHEAGVMQQDFHPGNFLVKNDCLILLDPGQIRFLGRPAGRTASIHQLAHLARILAPDDRPEAIELICSRYAESCRWDWGAAESALFWRFLRRGRRRGIRKTAKRPLYKGRTHVRVRTRDDWVVAEKDFFRAGDFAALVKSLDAWMDSGRVLEREGGVLVSRFNWARHAIMATRCDETGLLRVLRARLCGGVGRRRWVAGRRLAILRIATAMPLALIERRRGAFRNHSYVLAKNVEGPTLDNFLRDGKIPVEKKGNVVRQVVAVLERLAKYGMTRDGCELTRIFVVGGHPVFMVSGDVVIHVLHARCRRRYRDRRERFIQSLRALGFDPETLGVPTEAAGMPRFP